VLGALAARARQGLEQRQFNEERIARATRDAVEAALPKERLAAETALGERLGSLDVCALLQDALRADQNQ
jgi:hypothetical protein